MTEQAHDYLRRLAELEDGMSVSAGGPPWRTIEEIEADRRLHEAALAAKTKRDEQTDDGASPKTEFAAAQPVPPCRAELSSEESSRLDYGFADSAVPSTISVVMSF